MKTDVAEFAGIDRLRNGQVGKSDLLSLLTATGVVQEELFRQARDTRRAHGADQVHIRGVIEISNYCQKSCDYCAIRAPNKNLKRYRMLPAEILEVARQIRELGIRIVFLQAGQDPKCDAIMDEVIPRLKELGATVLLCLGERGREVYRHFRELGADSYILKYETSDPEMYEAIAHTDLGMRLECIGWIRETGMRIGVGNIVGLPGQSLDSLAEDILLGVGIKPDFISTSPLIPNQDTPFENLAYGDFNLTLNTMAINRLLHPVSLIPTVSALEKIHEGGQLMGLNAGANVVTINFTPKPQRDKYAIYANDRFVVSREHAWNIIKQAGLRYTEK